MNEPSVLRHDPFGPHGLVLHSLMSCPQRSPVKPGGHVQMKSVPTPWVQEASFWHIGGLLMEHGGTAELYKRERKDVNLYFWTY